MDLAHVNGITTEFLHGTTILFSAWDTATNKAIGHCAKRRRH